MLTEPTNKSVWSSDFKYLVSKRKLEGIFKHIIPLVGMKILKSQGLLRFCWPEKYCIWFEIFDRISSHPVSGDVGRCDEKVGSFIWFFKEVSSMWAPIAFSPLKPMSVTCFVKSFVGNRIFFLPPNCSFGRFKFAFSASFICFWTVSFPANSPPWLAKPPLDELYFAGIFNLSNLLLELSPSPVVLWFESCPPFCFCLIQRRPFRTIGSLQIWTA